MPVFEEDNEIAKSLANVTAATKGFKN